VTSPSPPAASAAESTNPPRYQSDSYPFATARVPRQYRLERQSLYSSEYRSDYAPPPSYPAADLYPPSDWVTPLPTSPAAGFSTGSSLTVRVRRPAVPAVVLLIAFIAVLCIAVGAAISVNAVAPTGTARAVAGDAPAAAAVARDPAVSALLTRRGDAVRQRNRAAFLADVDKADPAFAQSQETVYENLTKLPLIDFSYRPNPRATYRNVVPAAVSSRYGGSVTAAAVTISYRVEGVDSKPVAVPWVPLFAKVGGRLMVVGESADKSLPSGVGGQAWDAGAITVAHSRRVVGVFSAGNKDNPRQMLDLAERALDRVSAVRSGGWAGKIFLVAVRDRKVFDAYFGDSPERVEQVAAIAVPHYDQVHDWNDGASYTATRIIFNPDELSEDTQQIGDDLTHEFTHAAMAPVTSGWTPTWLVEGFAEYASYKGAQISKLALKRALRGVPVDDLRTGPPFYNDPMNYVTGWLACRMISETYGEAKLISLYEAFQTTASEEAAVGRVLGIPRSKLVTDWQEYVALQRA
jgi:hypothetical protein